MNLTQVRRGRPPVCGRNSTGLPLARGQHWVPGGDNEGPSQAGLGEDMEESQQGCRVEKALVTGSWEAGAAAAGLERSS